MRFEVCLYEFGGIRRTYTIIFRGMHMTSVRYAYKYQIQTYLMPAPDPHSIKAASLPAAILCCGDLGRIGNFLKKKKKW